MHWKVLDIQHFLTKFWVFKEKADNFLISKRGGYLRFGLLSMTVGAYPLIKLFTTGPLLSTTFGWRINVDFELPEHLTRTIKQQTFHWLEKEGRAESNTFFRFSCQKNADVSLDTIRLGTLSASSGAQIALPFYARFSTEEEALNYAKEHLEPFNVLGKVACIIWESEIGKQLLSTFVLSDEALAFLIARDLYSVQHQYLLTRDGLTWFCHTLCYMLCFYTIHMFWFNGSSIAFAVMFPLLFSIAFITAKHWNALAIFFTEHQADMEAAKLSQGHTRGGREFYSKFLLRNRILRELIEDGEKLFTEVGDYRKAIAEYVTRCGELERTQSDNDELTLSVEGDDYPGEI